MKFKYFLSIFLLLFFVLALRAQVSYTQSNYGIAGDTLLYSTLRPPGAAGGNYALAGANVNWNFANLVPTAQYTLRFLDPTVAGYMTAFVNQCIAAGGNTGSCTAQFNALTNVTFTVADTLRLGTGIDNRVTDDLISNNLRLINIAGGTTHVGGNPVMFTTQYDHADTVWVFPFNYGNADSSLASYTIDLNPFGVNTVYHVHLKRVVHTDGWGSITTPFGTFASTIRNYTVITQKDTIVTNGVVTVPPVGPTFEYSWFDPAYVAPVFVASGIMNNNGFKTYTQIRYSDRAICFHPRARVRLTPANPRINPSVGSVNVNFTNNTTQATSFYWNFGDPSSGINDTSSLRSPVHSYSATGTYVIQFVACNSACQPLYCDTAYYFVTIVDSGVPLTRFRGRPGTICANDSVVFTNGTTGATSYYWSFGDGNTSTATSPTHFYTTPGTYTVTLIGYNTIGADTAHQTITVQTAPNPVITITGPTVFCNGDSVILSATGGNNYNWSNGRLGARIVVRRSGTYTVTSRNSCGSVTSAAVVVTVNTPVDTLTATGDTAICQGDSVLLQANTGAGFIYRWRRNGQIIAGATNSTYYAKTNGSYVVNIIADSCIGVSNAIRVTVGALPNANITAIGSTANCNGDSVHLLANNGPALSYQWQMNGTNIPGATANNYYALLSGVYDAVVTRNGCSRTSNTIIVSTGGLTTPVIAFTGNPAFCTGDSLQLTTPLVAGYTYQWLLNGQNIAGAVNASYYATVAGSFSVAAKSGICSATSGAVNIGVNPLPVANAGPSQNLIACNVALSDTLGGYPAGSLGTGPYTYKWLPNTSLSADTVSNPVVRSLGSTTVYTLTVKDNNGCQASDSTIITITGAAGLSIAYSLTGASNVCVGSPDTIQLSASASGGTGPYTYSWTPANIVLNPADSSTIAIPVAAGAYTFTVVVADANGCQGSAFGRPVNIVAVPDDTISVLGTLTPCAGDSVILAVVPGSGNVYQWLNGGVPLSGETGASYVAYGSGNYSVFIAHNICADTSVVFPVTVTPIPTAVVSPAGPLSICSGQNAPLAASTGTGYNYQWYENGFGIGGATNATYTALDSAWYYVVVSVNNCSKQSGSVQVIVNQYPLDSVSVNGLTSFCAGGSVSLSTNSGSGYTYQWQNNGNNLSGATSAGISTDSSGLYDVVVTANGCSATSTQVQVAVTPYPASTVVASGTTVFCQGDSVVLSAPQGAGYVYQWVINGDSLLAGGVNNSITVADSASYSVIISLGSCVDTSGNTNVSVEPLPVAAVLENNGTIYNAAPAASYQWYQGATAITGATAQNYTPTQNSTYSVLVTDSSGCSQMSAPFVVSNVSVNTVNAVAAGVSVYPNPGHDAITIRLSNDNETSVSIKLYDLVGRVTLTVFEGKILPGENLYSASLAALPQGIYLLKADFETGTLVKKIVKQ